MRPASTSCAGSGRVRNRVKKAPPERQLIGSRRSTAHRRPAAGRPLGVGSPVEVSSLPSPHSHTLPLGGAESLLREHLAMLLAEARSRTLRLVAPISTENLERVHNKLMSP